MDKAQLYKQYLYEQYQAEQKITAPISPETDMEESASEEHDFNAMNMLGNVGGSTVQLAKDLTAPIHSPIQTAKGVGSLLEGTMSKMFGWDSPDEETVSQVWDAMKKRYGGVDRAQKSLENDPMGVVSDIAGILTGGGGLAVKAPGMMGKMARGVSKAGAAIDPLNFAVNAPRAALAALPASVSNNMMQSAMKFSTTTPGAERAQIADTMIKNQIMPTEKGMTKSSKLIDAKNDQVTKILAELDTSNPRVDMGMMDQEFNRSLERAGRLANESAPADVAKIDRMYGPFRQRIAESATGLRPSDLQDFKTDQYKKINWNKLASSETVESAKARRSIARGAKETLESLNPDLKGINADLGDLLNLTTGSGKVGPLERSANRIANRDAIGLGVPMKMMAGEAMMPGGAIVGAVQGLSDAPLPKAWLANKLGKYNKKGATGLLTDNDIMRELYKQIMIQSGRTGEEITP